jgi:hypothetical protein
MMNYGRALRYGKFAVISACRLKYEGEQSINNAGKIVDSILNKWLEFETYIASLPENNSYFITLDKDTRTQKQEVNFDGYYKGRTLNSDLIKFFSRIQV